MSPRCRKSVNGARHWIPLIIINIQVAELAKLLAIIFFSGYIAENLPKMANFKEGILTPITLLGCVAVLLLMQPDFGLTIVISICVMGCYLYLVIRCVGTVYLLVLCSLWRLCL
ncbi:FtsW/RodA/SpoVE family cell cycle protein [Francisella noatunensis]